MSDLVKLLILAGLLSLFFTWLARAAAKRDQRNAERQRQREAGLEMLNHGIQGDPEWDRAVLDAYRKKQNEQRPATADDGAGHDGFTKR